MRVEPRSGVLGADVAAPKRGYDVGLAVTVCL